MRRTDFTVPEFIYSECVGQAVLTKLIFKLGNVEFKDTQVAFNTGKSVKDRE